MIFRDPDTDPDPAKVSDPTGSGFSYPGFFSQMFPRSLIVQSQIKDILYKGP
jgi:hypothetical protein